MQDATVFLVGSRRELTAAASHIRQQFPELSCEFFGAVQDALNAARRRAVRLVIFHWRHDADRAVFDVLAAELQAGGSPVPFLVVADCDAPEVILHTLRAGATDCLARPLNLNRLTFIVNSLSHREPAAAWRPAADAGTLEGRTATAIYESPAMRRLLDSLRLAARADSTVLLTGETGTGKNHLAQLIHELSPRRHHPLVTVDCGSSSEHLIESDLFGHVRGAFTGADREHVGKLERVGSGTILLDEINSLPLPSQSRLLRALEERVFERLGGERTQRFNGRIVALTNKSLETEVTEKRFRSDLFYRLNVISFCVPPLREHAEDVPLLVDMFVRRMAAAHGRSVAAVSPEAMASLVAYPWPGNIRELRNVLERAVALSDSQVIETHHLHLPRAEFSVALPAPSGLRHCGRRLTEVRHEAERRELQLVLERHGNNRTHAARHLGISRSALYKRLEKLGLT